MLALQYGQANLHAACDYLFWNSDMHNERVIEICEENVWKVNYPAQYE